MKRTQSIASVTCLYLCTLCAFQLVLERQLGTMQHGETVNKMCVSVCVCELERREGVGDKNRECDATAVAD